MSKKNKKRSTCGYPGVEHGPIIAQSAISGDPFDICDLHVGIYKRMGLVITAKYQRDISSAAAVARRRNTLIGNTSNLRSRLVDARKDLL